MRRAPLALVCVLGLMLAFASSASAAPYMEVGAPSGNYAGKDPKGWVLLVHGGGWDGVGEEQVQRVRPDARRFNRHGWATMNTDYAPGAQSLRDVLDSYDTLRARAGRDGRVCLYGQSAGGHLVLMTASERVSVDCVIVEGAPTDLPALARQSTIDPLTHLRQTVGPRFTLDKATLAFGEAQLRSLSPLTVASKIRAPTLMGSATTDVLVPRAQMDALRSARPTTVKAIRLAGTTRTSRRSAFTHAYITLPARKKWEAAKRKMLKAAAR